MSADGLPAKGGAPIVAIWYVQTRRRWHPHSILTTKATWDANWSRAEDALLVHDSGSGHFHADDPVIVERHDRLWVAPGLRLARYRRGLSTGTVLLTPAALTTMGVTLLAKPMGDPFKNSLEVDGHIVWCSLCNDYYHDESNGPCEHLRWSDGACMMVGAGADEGDALDAVETALDALCSKLGKANAREMREAVRAVDKGRCHLWYRRYPLGELVEEHEEEDDCNAAVHWLATIGPGKRLAAARAQTLAWLNARLRKPFAPVALAGDLR